MLALVFLFVLLVGYPNLGTRDWIPKVHGMLDESRGTLRLSRDALGDERVPSLSLERLRNAYRTGSGSLRSWTTWDSAATGTTIVGSNRWRGQGWRKERTDRRVREVGGGCVSATLT